jgi:hypothetical protein
MNVVMVALSVIGASIFAVGLAGNRRSLSAGIISAMQKTDEQVVADQLCARRSLALSRRLGGWPRSQPVLRRAACDGSADGPHPAIALARAQFAEIVLSCQMS